MTSTTQASCNPVGRNLQKRDMDSAIEMLYISDICSTRPVRSVHDTQVVLLPSLTSNGHAPVVRGAKANSTKDTTRTARSWRDILGIFTRDTNE